MTLFEKLQSPGEVAAEQSFSKLLDCSLKRCSKWTSKWMNFLEMTPGCCSSQYWRGSALSRFSTRNLYGIIRARRKPSQSDKNFALAVWLTVKVTMSLTRLKISRLEFRFLFFFRSCLDRSWTVDFQVVSKNGRHHCTPSLQIMRSTKNEIFCLKIWKEILFSTFRTGLELSLWSYYLKVWEST